MQDDGRSDDDSSDDDSSGNGNIKEIVFAGDGGVYRPIAEILILLAVVGLFLIVALL
jgi:hypothetical protein